MTPYLDYNHTLEQNVLAACIHTHGVYSSVHHLLTPDCFHHRGYLQVYEAMCDVWQLGYTIDIMSVTQQLYLSGAEEISGLSPAAFVGTVCHDALFAQSPHTWCIQLRELAARRLIMRITQTRFADGGDVVDTAAQIQQLLTEAMQVRTINDWHHAEKAAVALCHYIENPDAQNNNTLSTTFKQIDETNGGFRPGQLIVLGARPAMGKSALAGNIALAAAVAGRHVGFISMEMPTQELFARIVSHHTGTRYKAIEHPNPEVVQLITKQVRSLATLPLHFADTASLSIHDIRAKAEQLQRTTGLDMLIVDYLQLIAEHGDSKRSREQNISAISRGLKMIAMNLNIPVIALSQLNRESEHRSNKRPTLADLRESGAIEQDADIVMLLHRDWRSGIEHDALGNSTHNQADLIISKWRNGSCFDIKLHFDAETMRFTEWET
jgi:replicative DNA helicase